MQNYIKLISFLFHSRTQTHIFHLQTPSFAEHSALQEYYDEIVPLIDGLVESYQGKYGTLTGYSNYHMLEYVDTYSTVQFLKALNTMIDELRQEVQDSYIQNQIDNVVQLIQSTLYKLRFLS